MMGNKIRILIALALIVGTLVWAFDRVRESSFSGSRFAFPVGSGEVTVINRGNEPIPVDMRAPSRVGGFRLESRDLDMRQNSKRQRIGNGLFHIVQFELPPGETTIDVTRGRDVSFVSPSSQNISAVVYPVGADGVRKTFNFAGVVILILLYYISRTVGHKWIYALTGTSFRWPRRSPA